MFDGSGDSLQIADASPLDLDGDFTVEGWIRQDSSSTQQFPIVMEKGNGSELANTWGLIINNTGADDQLAFFWGGPRQYLGLGFIAPDQWYHFAICRSGTSVYVFLDGVEGDPPGTTSANFSSTYNLRIGTAGGGSLNPFKGYLDDIRITKGIARYTANFTPPTEAFPTS